MQPSNVCWEAQGKAHPRLRCWGWLLYAGCIAGSCGFLPMLIPDDHHWGWGLLGALIGAVVGAPIPLALRAGARLTLSRDGLLTYSLGQRANFQVPLAAITRWGAVEAGALRGLAADCPLDQVVFLHRKGVTLSHLRAWQQHFGYAVVFEMIDPVHAAEPPRLPLPASSA